MTEESRRLKTARRMKLAAFTRKQKSLQSLLDSSVSQDGIKNELEELKKAFENLEEAHENYAAVLEDEEIDREGDYLEASSESLDSMKIKVSEKLKLLDSADKHVGAKVQFENLVRHFGVPSKVISDLATAKEISLASMQSEIDKIEASHENIKSQLMLLDNTADHSELLGRYKTSVVEEVERCKLVGLKYIKEASPSVPLVTVGSEETGGGASSTVRAGFSTTKRETVMLPQFSGDEKTAFLKYPVWKKQWENHINEYEPKFRATMLINHLDAKTSEQIIGVENEYDKAMSQLDRYYNDGKKIIKACLDEIRAHPNISAFDYKALVAYKKCLINNHTRLKASGLDHEMSNTAVLGVLIRKLPIQEVVKWQEYLSEQDRTVQAKPFPSFMLWLEKAGASWELLAASGTGTKSKTGSLQVHHTFFTESEEAGSSKLSKPCFKCGEAGHWKKECTKNSPGRGPKQTGGGKEAKTQKNRPILKHKKHHCALHKNSPGKMCSSWSCTALKYTPAEERIKLLKENGDCELCCGDCPKGDCQAKFKRTCGGNKDGRGCGTNHLGHELWCRNAQLCFAVQTVETVLKSEEETGDGVLLQVMRIPGINSSQLTETVLWDSACTGMFVRNEHARKMNFDCQEKRLRVTMLGGQVQEIDGKIYHCKIKDKWGNIHEFNAHGLDEVTGNLGDPLSKELMRQLFPNVVGCHKLTGATSVDYLIGLG